jgi:hypothetical protein
MNQGVKKTLKGWNLEDLSSVGPFDILWAMGNW